MSGALAERDFVEKLDRAGFAGIEVVERRSHGVDDCAIYPLFTDELIELMRTLIPSAEQERVATAIVVRATHP
ncbi:MAG: hypothetical protein ACRDJI_02095 [Actinomycetota bacterium]